MNKEDSLPKYNTRIVIYEGNCKKGYTHTLKEANNILN